MFLSNYLDTIFKEAEVNEISSLKHLCVWIQGNHEKLNYSCSKLDAHTHLDGDLNANSIINTHTVIIPLFIENTVTESFWLRWIGDVEHTITAKLKILNSIGMGTVSKEIRVPALSEWWKKLEEISTNEMCVKFPKKGEKLTLDFNSRNYLHGIKNIGKNLYLIILFDRCKLKI